MKKRSIAARLGVAALALTLATTSLSSGTLAKYVTTKHAEAQFTVARWNATGVIRGADNKNWAVATGNETVKVVGMKSGTEGTTDILQPGDQGYFYVDVAAADKIVGGQVAADANTSDVDMEYRIYINPVVKDNVPSHFKMWDDGKTGDDIWSDAELTAALSGSTPPNVIDLTAVPDTKDEATGDDPAYGWCVAQGEIKHDATGADRVGKKQIAWRWPYEIGSNAAQIADNDKVDTDEAATNGGQVTKFKVTILMTQKNPNAT